MPDRAPQIVLVIDDEADVVETTARMLRHQGFDVVLPPPGFTADDIARMQFDVLLTDLVMPPPDGFELIKAVRAAHPDVPIIAFSGFDPHTKEPMTMPGYMGKAVIGADLFLAKPLKSAELRDAILNVIAEKHRATC